MLQPFCLVADPYGQRGHKFAQVIDVPVFGLVSAAMPGNARPHAARAEGAANVNVVPRLDIDLAPASNLDPGCRVTLEDESIGSGF